jgi:hypothetical protein
MGSPLSLWMAFRLLRTHWVLYCATCRGVGAPQLLLVATIVLFRVQGCEEGSKSALVGLGHTKTLSPPGEPPSTFHVCPTSGRCPQVGHRAI